MNITKQPTLFFAIPVMDELLTLPRCLDCLSLQSYPNIQIVVCVNQPESFWNKPEKQHICESNAKTLELLKAFNKLSLTVIDRSSKGKGWTGKKHGVGWARKTVMDFISETGNAEDIIVSMDADTEFGENFAESIAETFEQYPKATALANPYYHKLSGDEILDRALLRYEIYMRYYAINLWRIKNPYCFTAIGSSMAVPLWAYRAIGGISPKLSGEDFYFMQKLRKYGSVIVWNDEYTYPATRYSDRVFFGTGPALIKGSNNDWGSYPMYSRHLFDEIAITYKLIDTLFTVDIPTPMSEFLVETFATKNLWNPLRENFKTRDRFRKSCAEKVDGLRILQYLKSKQNASVNEAIYLTNYLNTFHKDEIADKNIHVEELTFEEATIDTLNQLRDMLTEIENNYRRQYRIVDWY